MVVALEGRLSPSAPLPSASRCGWRARADDRQDLRQAILGRSREGLATTFQRTPKTRRVIFNMQSLQRPEDILRRIVIAIDGPAGSGKTTTAREVARALGLRHIDTGAMYRAITWKVLATGTDPDDETRVGDIAAATKIAFYGDASGTERVTADGTDVTEAVRSLEVTRGVSLVSSYARVRKAMVRFQRRLSEDGGVVLEGRDIGSVVLPGADVKVFLNATTEERARRRLKELAAKGIEKTFAEIQDDIERRDLLDSTRALSPLKIPVGAHVVDTTNLTIGEQVDRVVQLARETAAYLASMRISKGERNRYTAQRPWYAFTCAAIRALTRVLFGLRIAKKESLDLAENHIYASNHCSNADPPFVGVTIGREVHIMAKESLFRFPLFGRLIGWYNAMPMRRESFDRGAFERASEVLSRGGSLLIFPEGTRRREEGLGEPKAGVGYLALQTGVSVVPIYVSGTRRLRAALLRRPGLRVVHGHAIRFPNRETAEPTPDNYREFSRMVMAAIDGLREEVEEA